MLGGSASGCRSVEFCWVEFILFFIPGPRLRDSNDLAVGSSFDNDRDTKEQVETCKPFRNKHTGSSAHISMASHTAKPEARACLHGRAVGTGRGNRADHVTLHHMAVTTGTGVVGA